MRMEVNGGEGDPGTPQRSLGQKMKIIKCAICSVGTCKENWGKGVKYQGGGDEKETSPSQPVLRQSSVRRTKVNNK